MHIGMQSQICAAAADDKKPAKTTMRITTLTAGECSAVRQHTAATGE